MREKGSAVYQLFLLALSIYVLCIVFAEMFIVSDVYCFRSRSIINATKN